ncbi:hypothetical protein HK102_002836 [Quaeritorhiza haematococci]|nr:hypothetical protein HK102_002836 [Quaeritorhiza haematococci]
MESPLESPLSLPTGLTAAELVTGHIYLVDLTLPAQFKKESPTQDTFKMTKDLACDTPANNCNVNIRRHPAIVFSCDPITKRALLLVGTARPCQPHRFVPFLHTPRLPHQPSHFLEPNPPDAFSRYHRYLNFTHFISVTVLERACCASDDFQTVTPGRDLAAPPLSIPPQTSISEAQRDLLIHFHQTYWSGIRYSQDGKEFYNPTPQPPR